MGTPSLPRVQLRIEFPIPGFAEDGKLASPFCLEGGDVRCLQAFWTLGHIEFNRLPLGE
jgi:hypothetical protein